MGGEFTTEMSFTRGKWREKCSRYFRTRLLHSELILFKKGLLSFTLRALRI